MKECMTILNSTHKGYAPIWDYGEWRIAMTNDTEEMHKENIKTISKHMETDEVFVLLEGNANIYVGDGDETIGNITKYSLEPGKAFNVRAGSWHTCETLPGAKIFIVENRNTGDANTIKLPITSDMLK